MVYGMQGNIAKLETLNYYARKFQRLRVDRANGIAPHKPILLLSVIKLFERGNLQENKIMLSELLNQTFLKNWSYLGSARHNPDIARPFFHVRSEKFWHLYANPGFEKVLADKVKLKTLAEVKQAFSHAYLDKDLFDFLLGSSIRESLLAVLVGRWFPDRLDEFRNILQTDTLRDPPRYFLEAYAMYMDRLKEA